MVILMLCRKSCSEKRALHKELARPNAHFVYFTVLLKKEIFCHTCLYRSFLMYQFIGVTIDVDNSESNKASFFPFSGMSHWYFFNQASIIFFIFRQCTAVKIIRTVLWPFSALYMYTMCINSLSSFSVHYLSNLGNFDTIFGAYLIAEIWLLCV